MASQVCSLVNIVSIHAPTGGATEQSTLIKNGRPFQFTRPRGARPGCAIPVFVDCGVSIHAPTGGATSSNSFLWRTIQFQFTRPRGARHKTKSYKYVGMVSIHAPTGGATSRGRRPPRRLARFNSRAHGGRDQPAFSTPSHIATFQFTRPRGARRDRDAREGGGAVFQFTRPRGARPWTADAASRAAWFQFTRPRGARPSTASSPSFKPSFQFTRPRGARLGLASLLVLGAGFNSRAHGGRDTLRICDKAYLSVSIHAPTGGATRSSARSARASSLFQFTRPRGARRPPRRPDVALRVSIHAPTGGATVKTPPAKE